LRAIRFFAVSLECSTGQGNFLSFNPKAVMLRGLNRQVAAAH